MGCASLNPTNLNLIESKKIPMIKVGALLTVASIISGFGITVFVFRIQRELKMKDKDEQIWIPWADFLIIGAVWAALLLVILPLLIISNITEMVIRFSKAVCSSASILLACYMLAIMAHYRIIFGKRRSGPRNNPEPSERIIIIGAVILALLVFLLVFFDVL